MSISFAIFSFSWRYFFTASRPGCRVYVNRNEIPRVLGGIGINILTTPRGVMSGADALAKREAGADLVQIYTGFIYRGPGLVTEAARALAQPPRA